MNVRYLGLKKLIAAVIAVLVLAPAAVLAAGTPPVLSNQSATPNPFDPANGMVQISYNVDQQAVTTVEILDGGQVVRNLGTTAVNAGTSTIWWDGKVNGVVTNKTYTYRITASNAYGTNLASGSVTVNASSQPGTAPVVSNDYATPNPFNPNTQSSTINYTLNTAATVTVTILNGSTVIRTLASSAAQGAGTNFVIWDGRNSSSVIQPDGTYTYQIYAVNAAGNYTRSGSVTINTSGSNGTAPVVSNDYATPNPFNPNTQSSTINYTLNTAANVTVTILNGSTVIRTLASSAAQGAGTNFVIWDGRNSSSVIQPDGTYTYQIYAVNAAGNYTRSGSVTINTSGNNGTAPVITSYYVNPTTFDPDDEDTALTFSVDRTANIRVEVMKSGSIIDTIYSQTDRPAGTTTVYWDGRDDEGDQVADGQYALYITAYNAYGSDTESPIVRVDGSSSGNDDDYNDDYGSLIDDIRVNNQTFDPSESERAELLFDVLQDNTSIEVSIIKETNGNQVTTLVDRDYDETNNVSVYWNGRDNNNNRVNDAIYLFKIEAYRSGDHEVAYRYLEVDTDGTIIGIPSKNCGGFTDISSDNPYCKAVELMKEMGIFNGYSDGTFRPYQAISRAETTKVVLLAIGYSILSDDGTNLGFWDVVRGEWYMPYLRTARNQGIIRGYADGSFRPAAQPTRVELLKIFLEATGISIPYCSVAPYNDTPVNGDTRWYIDYACYAKDHSLMNVDSSGNFNPAAPMTRGDVAMLFYNFYVRGVYSASPYFTGQQTYNGYYPYGGQYYYPYTY